MASTGSSSSIFTGASRYSADFQSIIDRSVAIASLPLQLLQNQQSDLKAQSSALSGLNAKFEALQNAVEALNGAAGPSSYSAESSDAAAVNASAGEGALPATFTVDVLGLGSSTSTISAATLPAVSDVSSDSISSSSAFTLTVNGVEYNIETAGGGLSGLVRAINDSAAPVQASIVNTGSSDSPSYRLAIRGTKLSADVIQLNDGLSDLLDTLATGAAATYRVNGLATPISSDSRTILLAPGVTAELRRATPAGEPVTITTARDIDALRSAISDFVNAYNDVTAALDSQRGEKAGALSGQSLLGSLSGLLRQITQYRDTATGATPSRYGIELDSTGRLTFNEAEFSSGSAQDVLEFLGSDTAGFLKAATDALRLAADSGSGLIDTAIQSLNAESRRQDDLIARAQERVDDIRASLQERMAAADAAIASLEQQVTFMTSLFESMNTSNKKQ